MMAGEIQPGQFFTWHGTRHFLTRVSHPVFRVSSGGSGPARVVYTRSNISEGEELMWVLPDDDEGQPDPHPAAEGS